MTVPATFSRDEFTPIGLIEPGGVSGNYNPVTRGLLASSAIDPNLDSPQTDELLLSVEHALLPEFVVGLNLTFRQISDILEYERLVFDGNAFAPGESSTRSAAIHRRDDYALRTRTGTLPDGQNYILAVLRAARRRFVTQRLPTGERRPRAGVSRRLAHLQQAPRQPLDDARQLHLCRLAVEFARQRKRGPDDYSSQLVGAGIRDGDAVVQGSGTGSGSKGAVYINSEWSYSLNGLYQVAPDRVWGFNVGASVTGREGYPQIYFERFARATLADGAGLGTPVLIENQIDAQRFDDVHVLDLRVEKEFNWNEVGMTLGADLFNATNAATVMQRNTRLKNNTGDYVTEILSPRILRVGVKFSLR